MNTTVYTIHIKGNYNATEMSDFIETHGYKSTGVDVYESVADETLCARFDYTNGNYYFRTECMSFDDKDFYIAYTNDYLTGLAFALYHNAELTAYL